MSKVKIVIWILILAFILIVFYQNDMLFETKSLVFKTGFAEPKPIKELPVVVYFLAALFMGWVITYLFGLSDRFKARKTIKVLSSNLDAQRQEVASLKREIELLKSKPADASPAVSAENSKVERQPIVQQEKEQIAPGNTVETRAQPARKEIPRMASVRGESRQETEKKDTGEKEGDVKK